MRQHAFGPGVHIAYDDGKVRCPHCHTYHIEPDDERWTKGLNNNKRGYVRKKCTCGKTFGIALSMVDGMVGFTIRPRSYHNRRGNQRWIAWSRTTGYYRMNKALSLWQNARA